MQKLVDSDLSTVHNIIAIIVIFYSIFGIDVQAGYKLSQNHTFLGFFYSADFVCVCEKSQFLFNRLD